MNIIHAIRRAASVLAWLASILLASLAAATAALATPRPRSPGWSKHPPLPAHLQPLATGGVPAGSSP